MTPPTPKPDDLRDWLQLTLRPGVPASVVRSLLAVFGSPADVLAASHSQITALVPDAAVASAFNRGANPKQVDESLRWLQLEGNHLVALDDLRYPKRLLEAPDPPNVIYVRGRIAMLEKPAVAIVGSRNATPQGVRDAQAFARELSLQGLAIVSGLALGIDTAAHKGGLEGEGSTIAVLGTGADKVYPSSNLALSRAIVEAGCLVSEFPLGSAPVPGNFPRRNRLISGLSLGVVVVEAALRSGSLITARFALEQGREVFALPGSIHSPVSRGCHKLIRQGAKLVESAADILEEFQDLKPGPAIEPADEVVLPPDLLLDSMGFAPVSIDHLAVLSGLAASAVAARLTRLEIEGRITAIAGGLYQQNRSNSRAARAVMERVIE